MQEASSGIKPATVLGTCCAACRYERGGFSPANQLLTTCSLQPHEDSHVFSDRSY